MAAMSTLFEDLEETGRTVTIRTLPVLHKLHDGYITVGIIPVTSTRS